MRNARRCVVQFAVAERFAFSRKGERQNSVMDVTVLTALLTGLFSFISPCVFPSVPGYVSMLSGIGVEQLKEDKAPRAGVLATAFAFVIGFSVVFVALGRRQAPWVHSYFATGQCLHRSPAL